MMLEHQRAKIAYAEVTKIRDDLKTKKQPVDKFKSWAIKFPMMLQSCGLLQATAFYEDKNQDVYKVLKDWLVSQFPSHFPQPAKPLTQVISGLDMATYRLFFRETMAYMTWVKRAASVLMDQQTSKPDKEAP